ncbi:MAG: sigma-70 family RNA polymerase sigma factor [Neobacillus sp.]
METSVSVISGVNELYGEYKTKVYYLAFSFVKDRYLAEDLAHEILVKCYYSHQRFNGDCPLQAWVSKIARNHCIDFLRKANRRKISLHEDMELLCTDMAECTPESELITLCEQEELRRKLEQLPTKYKEVITLYYFKNLSLKEIQTQLNIKLSTIKTRLSRAKRMLREMY